MAAVGTNAFNLDAELYTGTRNNVDRGGTLVERHREKIQAEMEDAAMSKLQLLCPQLGAASRVIALQECQWNVEAALGLLRTFMSQNEEHLHLLHKQRKRLIEQMIKEQDNNESDDGMKKRSKKKRSSKEKKSKRSNKDKEKPKKAGEEYGRFGIIRETDAAAKSNEFIRWAMEVRRVDASILQKNDER